MAMTLSFSIREKLGIERTPQKSFGKELLTLSLIGLLLIGAAASATVVQASGDERELSGSWSGTLEGGWTETIETPTSGMTLFYGGAGTIRITFSYEIGMTLEIEDDGSFSGTATVQFQQPQMSAQYTTLTFEDREQYMKVIQHNVEMSPTEFVVPVHGRISSGGEMDLTFEDNPMMHVTSTGAYEWAGAWGIDIHEYDVVQDYLMTPWPDKEFECTWAGGILSMTYHATEVSSAEIPSFCEESAVGELRLEGWEEEEEEGEPENVVVSVYPHVDKEIYHNPHIHPRGNDYEIVYERFGREVYYDIHTRLEYASPKPSEVKYATTNPVLFEGAFEGEPDQEQMLISGDILEAYWQEHWPELSELLDDTPVNSQGFHEYVDVTPLYDLPGVFPFEVEIPTVYGATYKQLGYVRWGPSGEDLSVDEQLGYQMYEVFIPSRGTSPEVFFAPKMKTGNEILQEYIAAHDLSPIRISEADVLSDWVCDQLPGARKDFIKNLASFGIDESLKRTLGKWPVLACKAVDLARTWNQLTLLEKGEKIADAFVPLKLAGSGFRWAALELMNLRFEYLDLYLENIDWPLIEYQDLLIEYQDLYLG